MRGKLNGSALAAWAAGWVPTLTVLGIASACGGAPDRGSCDEYLACNEALGVATNVLQVTFGPDGTCWDDMDEDFCRAQCADGLASLAVLNPDEPICEGDSGPPACADELASTGNDVGDVFADYMTVDQNGESVNLYQYCDRAMLIMVEADWTGTAPTYIAALNEIRDDHPASALAIVALISAADVATVKAIASDNSARVDVWHDPDAAWGGANSLGSLPAFFLLKKGMVLASKAPQLPSEGEIAAAIE